MLFVDLIADAPHDYARMISITADQRAQILVVPVREKEMIVTWPLGLRPAIEGFSHHYESHAVTQIQKLRRRWIVARANRVATQAAQQLKLALCRSRVERHSQRS